MKTRRLGKTDLDLTVIGLGSWAIGGAGWDYGWGAQEESDSLSCILEALNLGINWIDTAAVYGLGRSEEVVGKALKQWGRPIIVATKCGLIGDARGKVTPRLKRESIEREVEASLSRLGVDVIDLYQIHWPNPKDDIEEAYETLQDLKAAGKIRWAGVSNFSVPQLERIAEVAPIASLQPPYSLIEPYIEREILPWCAEHGVGVVAYSPLQCGLLTGKVTKEWVAALPNDDWRKTKSSYFKDPDLSRILKWVEELKKIANESDHSLAQLAVSWVLRRPEVTSAIVGARKRGQIAEIVQAAEWELDDGVINQIEASQLKQLKY